MKLNLIPFHMMRLFTIIIATITLFSCNTETKPTEEIDVSVHAELSNESKIFLGNRLFSEKTCVTCHATKSKKIGPSVVEIMTIYKEKNSNIVNFLKGNASPIVDTNAAQVAIMQANIDGFLKNISDVELDAIQTYMMHVDELKLEY
jgi:cytochrome c